MYDQIVIVSDEWSELQGFYLNGTLQLEGQPLDVVEVLEVLGLKPVQYEASGEYIADLGCLPTRLEDLVLD